jgi:hypothetical protein
LGLSISRKHDSKQRFHRDHHRGQSNTIHPGANYSTIGGGIDNSIGDSANSAVIGGGNGNSANATNAFVGGGAGTRETPGTALEYFRLTRFPPFLSQNRPGQFPPSPGRTRLVRDRFWR